MKTPLRAAALLASAVLLTSCGAHVPDEEHLAVTQEAPATADPATGVPAPDAEQLSGAWCAPFIGGEHAHDEEGPVFDSVPGAGDVPRVTSAHVCSYGMIFDSGEAEPGLLTLWNGPHPVKPARMQDLNRLLGQLEPADPERVCTAEGGPTHLIHMVTDPGSIGLQIQDYGCGDVHFVSHPRVGPGLVGNPVGGLGEALWFPRGLRGALELLGIEA